MKEETKSISSLIAYMRKLEDEIRDIRQRLEEVERTVMMRDWTGTLSTQSSVHFQKIDSAAKELVDTIESAKVNDQVDPINLLVLPEVPEKIHEIKTVLTQLKDD